MEIIVSKIVNIVHCTVRTIEQYHFEITRYTNSVHGSIHTRQYFMLATLIKVIIFNPVPSLCVNDILSCNICRTPRSHNYSVFNIPCCLDVST